MVRPGRGVEPGAPAWVDLGTRAGTTTAARFYGSLFGWRVIARHHPLDDDSVGYWTFHQGGRDVGGLAPADEATWTVYLAVTDAEAMAQAVTDNGGAVLAGPMSDGGDGRLVLCTDPCGASFVLWQPGRDAGVEVADEADPLAWSLLACRDVEAATRFYAAVFGWEARTTPCPDGSSYTELFHPGGQRSIAGLVGMGTRWRPDVAPQWLVHFAVVDTDDTAARAAELGGVVSVAPFDLPNGGRFAVLGDPEQAMFAVASTRLAS